MRILLTRFSRSDKAILGRLQIFDDTNSEIFNCYTLENPHIGITSKKDYAIPEGTYTMDWRYSPGFSKKYNGADLPWIYNNIVTKDRYILIHEGNWETNTEGCILLGSDINGDSMITNSVTKVKEFLALMKNFSNPILKDGFIIVSDIVTDNRNSNKDEKYEYIKSN